MAFKVPVAPISPLNWRGGVAAVIVGIFGGVCGALRNGKTDRESLIINGTMGGLIAAGGWLTQKYALPPAQPQPGQATPAVPPTTEDTNNA